MWRLLGTWGKAETLCLPQEADKDDEVVTKMTGGSSITIKIGRILEPPERGKKGLNLQKKTLMTRSAVVEWYCGVVC